MSKIEAWFIRRKLRKMGEKAVKEGNMFGRIWSFLNGKKTAIGAALIAAPILITQGSALATSFGVDGTKAAQYAGAAIAAVGLGHRLYKLVYGSEPEAPKQ